MKITIARECGCYGDEVGQVLADRLNVPLYNKKTLTELAKKKGILEHYPDYFGENPAGTLLAVIAEDDGEDSVVHRTPRKVLDELIGETSWVLIGRAGNYAYRKENDVVRVFLSGDRESRIHHLMEKHKVKRHEAEAIIEKTEGRRKQYHMYYTGEDWGYAANYDLCINDTRFGIEGTADIIMQYVKDCTAQEK